MESERILHILNYLTRSTNETKSVTVRQGTNSITAPATLSGGKYHLTSSASQTVTLSSGGVLKYTR